jgi:hypothetical protein
VELRPFSHLTSSVDRSAGRRRCAVRERTHKPAGAHAKGGSGAAIRVNPSSAKTIHPRGRGSSS